MRQVEIVVKGHVDPEWSDWFDGFEITHTADGSSTLLGAVRDQAELRGMLSRLADVGFELISVNTTLRSGSPETPARGGDESNPKNASPGRETDQG